MAIPICFGKKNIWNSFHYIYFYDDEGDIYYLDKYESNYLINSSSSF